MADYANIFKGVVSVRRDGDIYTPLRFTQKQLNRYEGYDKLPACPFAYATANVTMEFTTTAETVSFRYLCGEIWNWWPNSDPQFDIYENGVLRIHKKVCKEGGTVEYRRQEPGAARIVIQLPHNAEIRICGFSAGEYTPVPARARRLLVLSDSIGQGLMGNSGCMNYATHLGRFYDMDVLNQSVGGDRHDPAKIDEDLPFDPTDVILSLGTNDAVSPDSWETLRSNIHSFYDKAAKVYRGKNVIVISPLYVFDFQPDAVIEAADGIDPEGWRPQSERLGIFHKVREELIRQAAEKGFRHIDGMKVVPRDRRYFSDGCHPNDLGFALFTLGILKELSK